MADLSIEGPIHEVPSLASCDSGALTDPSSSEDFLGFLSLMDDIFSHLLFLTTYIRQRFVHFIEDLVSHDILRCKEELLAFFEHPSSICGTVPEAYPSSSASVDSTVNIASIIVDTRCSNQGVAAVFEGLTLPLRLTLRLMLDTWRFSQNCMFRVRARCLSLASRLQKTLRGSSDDIGWLQRDPGMAPVVDRSDRFLELLEAIKNGEHKLPDSFVYLLIPGLFSNHGPLYFVNTKRFFSKMGLACHIAKIHSEASMEHNAWELKQYIEELFWGSNKRVMLLGHSKGGVDAAAALSLYRNELEDKVAGLALVQSPYGGTPIASDILREGQIADKETRRIMEFLICKLIKGDMRALEDLTYDRRREFIMKNRLPETIPLISFHSEARIAPGVLATVTRIAHAELPWLRLPSLGRQEPDYVLQRGRQVPVIIPVSAAMAICALHLQLRYGEKSDGLVTCRDAEVPGSVIVKPNKKLDHSFMVYSSSTYSSSSSSKRDVKEADASEMCEALLTMLVEIGEAKQRSSETKTEKAGVEATEKLGLLV